MTEPPTQEERDALLRRLDRRNVEYYRVAEHCRALFVRKNSEYEDAISDTGVLGAAVELVSIAARLRALVLHDPQHGRQHKAALVNALMDAQVYALIGLMMVDEDNWEGMPLPPTIPAQPPLRLT
jgi:predicted TIM-barrel enzyme